MRLRDSPPFSIIIDARKNTIFFVCPSIVLPRRRGNREQSICPKRER